MPHAVAHNSGLALGSSASGTWARLDLVLTANIWSAASVRPTKSANCSLIAANSASPLAGIHDWASRGSDLPAAAPGATKSEFELGSRTAN